MRIYNFLCLGICGLVVGDTLCDPDCQTWTDISGAAQIPHKPAGTCCPPLTQKADGTCPLDKSAFDPAISKCASYCAGNVYYEWGQEVYFLTTEMVGPDQFVNHDNNLFELPIQTRSFFRGTDIWPGNSTQALHNGLIGGYNDQTLMIQRDDPIWDTISSNDGNSDQGTGGYWTFIPLMKVTCGTYTESGIVQHDDDCASLSADAVTTLGNICIQEPVRYPDNENFFVALGKVQLIDIECKNPATAPTFADYLCYSEPSDAADHYSAEYKYPGVQVLDPNGAFGRRAALTYYNYNDATALNYWIRKNAQRANVIDDISPYVVHCLQAVGTFYTPLYHGQLNPLTDNWHPDTCIGVDPNGSRKCAVIGQFETCQVQLYFDSVGKGQNAVDKWRSDCASTGNNGGDKAQGRNLLHFLAAFARLFQSVVQDEQMEGSFQVHDFGKCQAHVAFAPTQQRS